MSWKDPFVTLTFPKKVIFIVVSYLLFAIHTAVFIGDMYHFLVSQRVDLMSFHYTIVLLFSHVASFYWALLASIYTMVAEDNVLMRLALTSLAFNFAIFFARIIMDYVTIEYREEQYQL